MRVVYDCTIVVDHDANEYGSSTSRREGGDPVGESVTMQSSGKYASPDLRKKRKRVSVGFDHQHDVELSDEDEGGGRGVLTDVRTEYERISRRGTPRVGRSRTTSKTTSLAGDDIQSGEVDLQEGMMSSLEDGLQGFELRVPGEEEIVHELSELVGLPEITTSTTTSTTFDVPQVDVWGDDGAPLDESELPEEVRIALREIEEGGDSSSSSGSGDGRGEKRIIRPKQDGGGYSYEIEVEETTTTTTTTVRTIEEVEEEGRTGARVISRQTRNRNLLSRGRQKKRNLVELSDEGDEDWVAVGQGRGNDETETDDESLPSAINGRRSLAVRSRKEALEHPAENRQRLQVNLQLSLVFFQLRSLD
jgi:hypothetical protein